MEIWSLRQGVFALAALRHYLAVWRLHGAQTLLVVGLSAPEECSELVNDLQKLLREQAPAAVLFVSGRDRTQTQSQTYAAAFSL